MGVCICDECACVKNQVMLHMVCEQVVSKTVASVSDVRKMQCLLMTLQTWDYLLVGGFWHVCGYLLESMYIGTCTLITDKDCLWCECSFSLSIW